MLLREVLAQHPSTGLEHDEQVGGPDAVKPATPPLGHPHRLADPLLELWPHRCFRVFVRLRASARSRAASATLSSKASIDLGLPLSNREGAWQRNQNVGAVAEPPVTLRATCGKTHGSPGRDLAGGICRWTARSAIGRTANWDQCGQRGDAWRP